MTADWWRLLAWIEQERARDFVERGERISPNNELFFGDAGQVVGGATIVLDNFQGPTIVGRYRSGGRRKAARSSNPSDTTKALRSRRSAAPALELDAVLALIGQAIGPLAALRFGAALQEVSA